MHFVRLHALAYSKDWPTFRKVGVRGEGRGRGTENVICLSQHLGNEDNYC